MGGVAKDLGEEGGDEQKGVSFSWGGGICTNYVASDTGIYFGKYFDGISGDILYFFRLFSSE